MSQLIATLAVLLAIGGAPSWANAAGVTIDDTTIAHATSTMSNSIEITEYREGTDNGCPRLLAGCKRYAVCILSPAPIAVLDAEFPQSATATRFSVGVEDGREFSRCLLNTLNTADDAKRAYTYCFKCEDVTTPPPRRGDH